MDCPSMTKKSVKYKHKEIKILSLIDRKVNTKVVNIIEVNIIVDHLLDQARDQCLVEICVSAVIKLLAVSSR